MAVKTSDTDPRLVSGRIREILSLEAEIDMFLLVQLWEGKARLTTTVSDQNTLDILLLRYRKNGWVVVLDDLRFGSSSKSKHYSPPSEQALIVTLCFEDPAQLELTRPFKRPKLNTVDVPLVSTDFSSSVGLSTKKK